MATEKSKDAGASNEATQDQTTLTEEKRKDYLEALSDSINAAKAEKEVNKTNLENCCNSKEDSGNGYKWANEGVEKYNLLSLGSTNEFKCPKAGKSSEPKQNCLNRKKSIQGIAYQEKNASEVLALIKNLSDRNKKALDERWNAALKGLKALNEKVKTINEAFCKVEAEIGDNCNNAQLQVLKTSINVAPKCEGAPVTLQKGDTSSGGTAKGATTTDPVSSQTEGQEKKEQYFEHWIAWICNNVKNAGLTVNQKLDNAVQVASANATVNFANLLVVSQTLESSYKSLREDIDKSLGFFEEEKKQEAKKVKDADYCLSENWFNIQESALKLQGYYKSCEFVVDPKCSEDFWKTFRTKIKDLINPPLEKDDTSTNDESNPDSGSGENGGDSSPSTTTNPPS